MSASIYTSGYDKSVPAPIGPLPPKREPDREDRSCDRANPVVAPLLATT